MSHPSVQLYSVREAAESNLDHAIVRLAEIGFTYVEPYAFPQVAADLKRAMKGAGVVAPSGHAGVIDSDVPEAVFDAAAELGIGIVIDPYIPASRWQTADDVRWLADRVNELSAIARDRGLSFGYHNHQWEFANKIDGRPVYDHFVAQLDPAVVLELDTFWATVGGSDAAAVLRELGDRVVAIHVKDGKVTGDIATVLPSDESALEVPDALRDAFEKQTPAGQGDIDVKSVLAAAPHALRVVEFDAYRGDVFEGICESFAWLAQNDTEASA